MAYIADMYATHTLVGEEYDEETLILQINLTYGIGKKDDKPIRKYYVQDNKEKKFVTNLTKEEIENLK
ncbi:MAG: hypothetical protein J6K21_00980 [Bacilli bacterium]|nr:hypothetical protein [Bacilli bacterium]